MKIKKRKGFTLIELLIVVAIIAILAAIAIPQFAQYRIRGYNAAANSDIRNAKTAEEALFADYQAYGDAGYQVVVATSPVTLTTEDFSSNSRTIQTALSASVSMEAYTDNTTSGKRGTSYLIFAKHLQGDREFLADGNTTSLYWCSGSAGAVMTKETTASSSADDISTLASTKSCAAGVSAL